MNSENVIDTVSAQQAALLQFKLIICVEQVCKIYFVYYL